MTTVSEHNFQRPSLSLRRTQQRWGHSLMILVALASVCSVALVIQSSDDALVQSLCKTSQALMTAGDLTTDMASKLPNWYSSKEGLTGESPAVFGGCGMSLTQAGKSLVETNSTLTCQFRSSASDLAAAACALDPIGIGEEMDSACGALDAMADCCCCTAESEDTETCLQQLRTDFVEALRACGEAFRTYGDLLSNEDPDHGPYSAGRMLFRAGNELNRAGQEFALIQPTRILARAHSESQKAG